MGTPAERAAAAAATGGASELGRLIGGGKKRKAFDMPTGDRQHNDPTKIGGGVGIEHMRGNDPSGYTAAPDETLRYRGMGEAAAARQAYQVDFGKAMGDEARGLQARDAQVAGLNDMRNAARGGAPSQAAILGNQAAGQSLQAQMQAGAGGRGLGAVAAQQQAAAGVQAQQLGNVGQFAGMRGAEMGRAQSAYGQAGGQVRAGDYAQQGMAQQRAEAQGQAEATQRRLNQEAQMGYEQMGINNQQAQSDSDLRNRAVREQQNADQRNAHDARNARNMSLAVAGMTTLATLGAKSDVRSKQNVHMLSDDHTKVVAAQRAAFTAGLSHANGAADTGKFGALPAYMEKDSSPAPRTDSTRDQPPRWFANGMPAVRGLSSMERADRAPQEALNRVSEANYERATTEMALPGGALMGHNRRVAEDVRQRDRSNTGNKPEDAPPPPEPPGVFSRLGGYATQMRAMASDERTKQSARAENDMGRALEEGFRPFEYEYKPEFADSEGQAHGEKNVGPMAQNMAGNSITGNAVEKGEDGLLRISIPKVTKTNSAGIGYLAARMRQQDEEIAKLKGGR